jgi:hypothetical protein
MQIANLSDRGCDPAAAENNHSRLDRVSSAVERLNSWIEAEHYAGWDPYDAMNSPLLRKLSVGRHLEIVWTQLLKRCPINLRPLLGVPKGHNPKGMGLFMASAVRRYLMQHDSRHLDAIGYLYRWLLENHTRGYSGYCWGYNFDWSNRSFAAPAGTPTVVNTSFIAQSFLDVHILRGQLDGLAVEECDEPLVVARRACDFILNDLNIVEEGSDELCFSYTPLDKRSVHNANMLGACLLAAVYEQTGEEALREAALQATRYTVRRQRCDGSWPYGEARKDRWVDNYHTGFVLSSLKRIGDYIRTPEFDKYIDRGYWYWKKNFFLENRVPRYYSNKTYPIDVHSAAQAILTSLEFRSLDPDAELWALELCDWAIRNMQDKSGYFYHQLLPRYSIRIPYIRWSQAWMQRALTETLFQVQG